MAVRPSEQYRFEHEVHVDEHRLGSDLGLSAGEIEIERGSDGLFWNGSTFVSGTQTLATTAAGSTTDPHHYFDFTIPAAASDGEVFNVAMRAARSVGNADPATEKRFQLLVRTSASVGGGSVVIVVD